MWELQPKKWHVFMAHGATVYNSLPLCQTKLTKYVGIFSSVFQTAAVQHLDNSEQKAQLLMC